MMPERRKSEALAPWDCAGEVLWAGPDGALWFTSNGNNSIGRITTAVAR